jgi:molybdopterin molybdotransferase
MAQLSADCFAHGGKLMSLEEALALIDERTTVVADVESIPLRGALGRILAEDLVARFAIPPHANSAVDGYAIRFDDLSTGADTVLRVRDRAAAGHPASRALQAGEAIRVFTGAVMPEGADTVMMQEDCRLEGDRIVIPPGVKPGANRRRAGEDVEAGAVALGAGTRLRPQEIGLAASLGLASVPVRVRLRAALLSTGDEILEPGQPLTPGHIYDSNRYTLSALLTGLGVAVSDLGILPDREPTIRAALEHAARDHDLILSSGGVSVGEEDHVKAAVEALGSLYFWRLAIKPGRPIALGQIGATPFVGLPGNPVAAMVTFLRLVRPLILKLAGARDRQPPFFRVRAGFEHRKKKGRREWVRVSLVENNGSGLEARKFPRQGAGILSSLVASDGLAELPEDLTRVEPGTMVDVLPFAEVL